MTTNASIESNMEKGNAACTSNKCSVPGHDNAPRMNSSARSMSRKITRRSSSLEVDWNDADVSFCRYQKRVTIACDDELFMREASMNHLRLSAGLYKGYPLAQSMLKGAPARLVWVSVSLYGGSWSHMDISDLLPVSPITDPTMAQRTDIERTWWHNQFLVVMKKVIVEILISWLKYEKLS